MNAGLRALADEYRPTMGEDELHSWARDVVVAIPQRPTEAEAAVAELIEADKAFDIERKGYNPLYANRERLDRYEAAEKRRAVALARVQGVQS